MVIQLAKHQKLDLFFRKPGEDFSRPLLHVAMSNSAPIWMLQKILALVPQAIHVSVKRASGEMPVLFFILQHMQQKNQTYVLGLLEFLIKNGADLESYSLISGETAEKIFQIFGENPARVSALKSQVVETKEGFCKISSFRLLRDEMENFPSLKSKFVEIIIEKHGEQYFNRLEEEYTKTSKNK